MNEFNCKVCGGDHLTGSCGEPVIYRPLTQDTKVQKGVNSDEENDGLSEPAQFFAVPTDPNSRPLSPDDKTPVVRMRHNTVTELDQEDMQRKLRAGEVQAAQDRVRRAEKESEAREVDEIFRAVEEGDEDFIASLLKRNVLNKTFDSLQEFESSVVELISKGAEFTTYVDIANLDKPNQYKSVLELVLRPRIGNESPFVEIKIGNKVGLGKHRDRKMSEVISVKIQPDLAPAKELGFWEKLFGKK